MRRGTRVGQAYVAVTADGSGINEEIVDSVDDAGKDIDSKGDEHGRRYGDHFSEGFFSRIRGKLSKRLSTQMGDAGDDAGDRFGSALVQRLRERLDGATDLVDRLGADFDRASAGRTTIAKLEVMAHRLRTAENSASRLERELRNVMKAEGLLMGAASRVSGNGRRTGLTSLDDWLRGTHSRNNFVNFFAKSLGGLVHGIEKMALFSGDFFKNMQKAGEGASFLQKIMAGFGAGGGEAGGIGAAFKGIAASAGPAAAGIGVVAVALTIMVSVVGSLLALLTALSAALVSGLTAALLVTGGALAAVTAGAGLLVSAFMSMTDAQQSLLKNAFSPLKAELTGIAQIMLKDMVPAFKTWSANLQQALLQAVPVAQVMGKAFADAGNILTSSLSGPGFQRFAQALATWLPSITTRLSSALGSFLNGLLALFSALLPYVNQFAGYLAKVADEFSRWANSPQGQNTIADWVARAVASLKSLWGFVGSFTGFLTKVLFSPEAQAAGNTIFDSLSRTFQDFTKKIAQAQANGSFKKWFDDAIKFGGQLWAVIQALGKTFMSLYNSGVLAAVGEAMGTMANVINALNSVLNPLINALGFVLPTALKVVYGPLNAIAGVISKIGQAINWALSLVGKSQQAASDISGAGGGFISGFLSNLSSAGLNAISAAQNFAGPDLNTLIASGNSALNATSIDSGGFKPPKKWKNPWKKWALSLIKEGPSISAQIKNAILSINKQAAAGILAASRSSDSGEVQASLQSLSSSIATSAKQTVNTARSALNSAATNLANATSKGAAKKALAQVKKAQKDLKTALADQKKIQAAAKIINAQRVVTSGNVTKLLQGLAVQNATLADYAEARSRVAALLDDANKKLTEAIALRDNYSKQVSDSIKEFGGLLTAQAQVINGVEQALTANDITSNLQARLDKIKKFQNDLRLLLAQGLSNDAYKQIVDAGVEAGSTIADALLAGGTGAIQNVNSLVGQINGIADSLGSETSSRLYQAGVDAAQGLVDGLNSLAAQLDAAAIRLGNAIAQAVKNALGIRSPSRVLYDMMDYVGDGAAAGLDNQHVKVGSAAARLAERIAVTPGGTYSSSQGSQGVSGNQPDPRFRDLVVHTPTEDPHAVAMEVLNEVTGRI